MREEERWFGAVTSTHASPISTHLHDAHTGDQEEDRRPAGLPPEGAPSSSRSRQPIMYDMNNKEEVIAARTNTSDKLAKILPPARASGVHPHSVVFLARNPN